MEDICCLDCKNFKVIPKSKLNGRFQNKLVARCIVGMILDNNEEEKKFVIRPNSRNLKGLHRIVGQAENERPDNHCTVFEDMRE